MNISKSFSVVDPSVNNGAGNYSLSVRISSVAIDFCILNHTQNMIVALESWNLSGSDNLNRATEIAEKIKESQAIRGKKFQNIFIIPDNSFYTLIPEKLFIDGEAGKYTDFIHHLGANEKSLTDSLSKHNIKITYWLPYESAKLQSKIFPDSRFCHPSTILINSFLPDNNSPAKVLVHFSERRTDILVSKEGRLIFINSFNFVSIQDIAYYLVNVYRRFDLDVSVVPVQLAGEIEHDSAAFEIIYKFIRHVSFAERNSAFGYCEGLNDLPKHLHFVLFNSFICA